MALHISTLYALVGMIVFVIMVMNEHKINIKQKASVITVSFFWPALLGILVWHGTLLLIGIVRIWTDYAVRLFKRNWKNLK